MPEAWNAVDHRHARLDAAIKGLDGLHDRRFRQPPFKNGADEVDPATDVMTCVGVTPYSSLGAEVSSMGGLPVAMMVIILRGAQWRQQFRHCEPTGRANARPMTGSAKQSRSRAKRTGLLRRLRFSQ